MRKLLRDKRGSITIIVSLMLIPALLLSGTAVDLSRIHAARSVAHNANQLAANAALTQYDALLKDLYGIFGVAEEDPILADMLNEYVEVAVLGQKSGEEWIDTGLGTFQPFQGSTVSVEMVPADKYNLGEPDILRRQIEEYMKIRGPVILVEQLLKSFETMGSSVKVSSEAIEQQEVIGNEMVEFVSKYAELYKAIVAADLCKDPKGVPNLFGGLGNIVKSLENIKKDFVELESIRDKWEDVKDAEEDLEDARSADPQDDERIEKLVNDLEDKNEYEDDYADTKEHIQALATGGSGLVGIETQIETVKGLAEDFKENFQKVVDLATDLDSKRDEIRPKIIELQETINKPDCDPSLKTEMQTIIDECSDLLNKYPDLTGMAKDYQIKGDAYIETFQSFLDSIEYRDKNRSSSGSLSIEELGRASGLFSIDNDSDAREVATYAGFSDVSYDMPPGFTKYKDITGKHGELYSDLENMASMNDTLDPHEIDGLKDTSGSDDVGTQQKNIIDQLVELARIAKDGLINNPLGAERVEDTTVQNAWPRAFNLGNGVIEMLDNPAGAIQDMADFSLILTYGTGMFSNYTTGKPAKFSDDVEVPPITSITGVPMSPKVNYYYQSEWEYLLVGDKDADENLDAVKNLIYVIRIVCNTIASLTVPDVKNTADAVKTAVTPIPYIGPALGVVLYVATFAAFACAESTYDIVMLRNGCKVPLLKMNGNGWMMQVTPKDGKSGIVNELKKIGENGGELLESSDEHNREVGISYEQYMLSFFIVDALTYGSSIETLVSRMGNLIEWNVINYESKANASHVDGAGKVNTEEAVQAMSSAFAEPECFRRSKRHTDFDVTTTIDLRLYFLTLPMFKNQGSPFTNNLEIRETDYRGY